MSFYVRAFGTLSNGQPSGEDFYLPGGGGGGGDISFADIINSGSSVNAVIGGFYGWNSASGVAKTLNAPAATGSLGIIESADMFGDAFTHNITFNPFGTDAVIGNQNVLYSNYASARWRDVAVGIWANV